MKTKLFAIVLAACSVAGAAAGDAKLHGGNLLAAETYSFRDLIKAGKYDMVTIPALYKELGIKGISYNDLFFKQYDDAYLNQIIDSVKKNGRVVSCFVIEGNMAMKDEAKRKAQIESNKMKLRVASKLGAPVVRINVGRVDRGEDDSTVGVERVIAAFKELLPVAQELKIRMSVENHGGVSKSADNIVRVIKGTDPKWVGALVDFGNFPPENRYEEIEKVAPYAFVTHVKINNFEENGEAKDYDFPRVLKTLKANRYKGPISIEFEGEGDPIVGVQKSKALILKYW